MLKKEAINRNATLEMVVDRVCRAVDAWAKGAEAIRFEVGMNQTDANVLHIDGDVDVLNAAEWLVPEIKTDFEEAAEAKVRLYKDAGEDMGKKKDLDVIYNALCTLSSHATRAGFWIGQLFAARLAGVSEEEMQDLKSALITTLKANPIAVRG